jgi:cathepsin B
LLYSGDSVACPNTFGAAPRHYVNEYCISSSEEGIKREILKNGPVIAVVPIYRDFLIYKEGVYDVEESA